jgi:K+-transporting ATPase KdpF subunit
MSIPASRLARAAGVKRLDAICMPGRQDRVNDRQGGVKCRRRTLRKSLTGTVIENLVAGMLGIGLLVYLVYALIRPERF